MAIPVESRVSRVENINNGMRKLMVGFKRRLDRLEIRVGRIEIRLDHLETRFDAVDKRLDRIDIRLDDLYKLIVAQTRWYLAGIAAMVLVLTLVEKVFG